MNRNQLKTYAPKARRDFIRAMTDRAAVYGLTKDKIEPVTEQGDVAIIAGKPYPSAVAAKRELLAELVRREGFDHVMESMAYTWFNRLVAVRYMELHGYLDHGYRVLSHPEGKSTPEIVEQAEHVDLTGLDKNKVIALKLDGTKEAELYRMLLIAQCNALHSAMPFLFERIDDETELLLPDNLLHSDSLIRQLVNEIDEADWQEVEIIGWLYESYIAERYEAVIGRVVASEDIPAATQRFTPKWVVRYLVQNTLGRLWLSTYPEAGIKAQMRYYIEPAEQTAEVQEQLRAITPTSLNPEEITFLDPACGSGHILVEAYDLFKAIYLERGYRAKDIPQLIVEKNLFGLEIDDRAAQLAAFALMMKARADDRRIFQAGVQPHVHALIQTDGMDAGDIAAALNVPAHAEPAAPPGKLFETDDNLFTRAATATMAAETVSQADVAALISLFKDAKTFGSLIQVPPPLAARLPQIEHRTKDVAAQTHTIYSRTATGFSPVIEQARVLATRYDCVVANPPYMGSKYCNAPLKAFIAENYENGKADMYACFIQRSCLFAEPNGFVGMITIPNWMFLTAFDQLRQHLLASSTFDSLIHNGRGVWGSDFGSCSFVIRTMPCSSFRGVFRRLFDVQGSVADNDELQRRFFAVSTCTASASDFCTIPGSPLAYWLPRKLREAFSRGSALNKLGKATLGMNSTNNALFVRLWHEVDVHKIGFGIASNEDACRTDCRWFPYNKGGDFRKWYGNRSFVIDWYKGGKHIHEYNNIPLDYRGAPVRSKQFQFKESITWSFVSSSFFGVRYSPQGSLFDVAGSSYFTQRDRLLTITAFLISKVAGSLLQALNPTLNFQVGNVATLPIVPELWSRQEEIESLAADCIDLARKDWDLHEESWDFSRLAITTAPLLGRTISEALYGFRDACLRDRKRMAELETENNRVFVEAFGVHDEVATAVTDDEITLYRPDREEDIKRLVSYAVGCMMGRYSLDTPGLVYAHSGNIGFDASKYRTFPADADGIVPLMETEWFPDDAANRFFEFIGVVWHNEHLDENLAFVAESLGPTKGEQPRDTIRRYLATGFFKHHLQMYKRRPIYWLFSSGRQRAFQCLVYLHRHHEGTLSRMRTEYVIPLQGKISARIDQLADDIAAASSTAFRSKLTKERDKLLKQQAELQAFDEKLRHYADLRISLDLDDGVKVNYGKFGGLLAEVKAVTGGKDDE